MCVIVVSKLERIELYLRQLAPHQRERQGPLLLRAAADEIKQLRAALANAEERPRMADNEI